MKRADKIPKNVQKLILQWKKEGIILIDELMDLLGDKEDIELLDKIFDELMQQEIELVEDKYDSTWALLEAYDRWAIKIDSTIVNKLQIDTDFVSTKLEYSVEMFRENRIKKGEASEIFWQEKNPGSVESIIKDIFQTWDGQDLYSSVEEKAAHLLYFMIKNHPFVDGNKRCGAFAFIFFLQQTKAFDLSKINYQTLSVIALLVAESDPKNKDLMIQVIIHTVLTLLIKI